MSGQFLEGLVKF